MSYSPIADVLVTGALFVLLAAALFDLAAGWYFGRKAAEMYRRGRMWGGE